MKIGIFFENEFIIFMMKLIFLLKLKIIFKISLEQYTKQRKQLQNQLQNDIEYKENLRPLYLEHYDKVNQLDEDIIKTNYKIFQQTIQQLDIVIQKLKGVRNANDIFVWGSN